jgi:hypothetical protein
MSRFLRRIVFASVPFFFPIASPVVPDLLAQSMQLAISSESIQVHGARPGATIALIGLSRMRHQYASSLSRIEQIVVDEDRNGVVSFTPKNALPWSNTVLVAVDLLTADYALRNTDGGSRVTLELSPNNFIRESGGVRQLQVAAPVLEIYQIRQGGAVWATSAAQGSRGDEDLRNDGKLTVSPGKARKVSGIEAAPNEFRPGDLLIVMDPFNMTIFAGRVQS